MSEPVESKIVVGYMSAMTSKNMRIAGRSSARGTGRAVVDITYVKDLAERRTGKQAEAAVGRQLLNLAAEGKDVNALAKAMNELFALGDGVRSEKPSPTAVAVANRIVSPESIFQLTREEGGVDLIHLAYGVLHYDEVNRLNGGLS